MTNSLTIPLQTAKRLIWGRSRSQISWRRLWFRGWPRLPYLSLGEAIRGGLEFNTASLQAGPIRTRDHGNGSWLKWPLLWPLIPLKGRCLSQASRSHRWWDYDVLGRRKLGLYQLYIETHLCHIFAASRRYQNVQFWIETGYSRHCKRFFCHSNACNGDLSTTRFHKLVRRRGVRVSFALRSFYSLLQAAMCLLSLMLGPPNYMKLCKLFRCLHITRSES